MVKTYEALNISDESPRNESNAGLQGQQKAVRARSRLMLQQPEEPQMSNRDRLGGRNGSVLQTHSSHEDNGQSHIELESFERPPSPLWNQGKPLIQHLPNFTDTANNSSDEDFTAERELFQATKLGAASFSQMPPALAPSAGKDKNNDSEDDIYKYKGKRDPRADFAARIYIEGQPQVEEADFEYRLVVRDSSEVKRLQQSPREKIIRADMNLLREQESLRRLQPKPSTSDKHNAFSEEATTIEPHPQTSHSSSKNHSFKTVTGLRETLVERNLEKGRIDQVLFKKHQGNPKGSGVVEKAKGFASLSTHGRADAPEKKLTNSVQEGEAEGHLSESKNLKKGTSPSNKNGSANHHIPLFPSDADLASQLGVGYLVGVNSNHLAGLNPTSAHQEQAHEGHQRGSGVDQAKVQFGSHSFAASQFLQERQNSSPKSTNLLESGLKRVSITSGTTGTPKFEACKEMISDDEYTLGQPTPNFSSEKQVHHASRDPKSNFNLSKKLNKSLVAGAASVFGQTRDEYAFGNSANRSLTPRLASSRRTSQNSVKSRISSANSSKLYPSSESTAKKITKTPMVKRSKDSAASLFKKVLAEASRTFQVPTVISQTKDSSTPKTPNLPGKGPGSISKVAGGQTSRSSSIKTVSKGFGSAEGSRSRQTPNTYTFKDRRQPVNYNSRDSGNNYMFAQPKSRPLPKPSVSRLICGEKRRMSGCSATSNSKSPSVSSWRKNSVLEQRDRSVTRLSKVLPTSGVIKRVDRLKQLNSSYGLADSASKLSRSSQFSFHPAPPKPPEKSTTKRKTPPVSERSNSQKLKSLVQAKLGQDTLYKRSLGHKSPQHSRLGSSTNKTKHTNQMVATSTSGYTKTSVKQTFVSLMKDVHNLGPVAGSHPEPSSEIQETSNLAERSRSSQILNPKNNPHKSICQNEPSQSLRSLLKQMRRDIHSGSGGGLGPILANCERIQPPAPTKPIPSDKQLQTTKSVSNLPSSTKPKPESLSRPPRQGSKEMLPSKAGSGAARMDSRHKPPSHSPFFRCVQPLPKPT